MGKEEIVEAIISDAQQEAQEIIAQAEAKAASVKAAASDVAEKLLQTAQSETQARSKAILEGKAATARLDGAKILLAEKRRVVAAVYARAYERLEKLGEKEVLPFMARLLEKYASEGDEVALSSAFRFKAAFEKLPVVTKKKLKVVTDPAVKGGFVLRGKNADVDLSFETLLVQDKDEHQSEIAGALFK